MSDCEYLCISLKSQKIWFLNKNNLITITIVFSSHFWAILCSFFNKFCAFLSYHCTEFVTLNFSPPSQSPTIRLRWTPNFSRPSSRAPASVHRSTGGFVAGYLRTPTTGCPAQKGYRWMRENHQLIGNSPCCSVLFGRSEFEVNCWFIEGLLSCKNKKHLTACARVCGLNDFENFFFC